MESIETMTGLRLPSRDAVAKFLSSGSGYGYGSGYSSGTGSGYGYGSGDGSGSGYGYSSGYGSGYGDGYGYGSGYGSGYGYSSGSGDGSGDGSGYGSGYGYGYSSGSGDGSGDGSGYGDGDLLKYEGCPVDYIDGTPCVICAIRRNYANVLVIGDDLQIKQAYVARVGDSFGHGESIREAYEAARQKELEDMPVEEWIAAFVKEHPDPDKAYGDLFSWHHTLTGSCEFGRKEWCRSHGYQPDDSITVRTFIEQTRNDYGGDVIRQLAKEYNIEL